MAGLSSGDRSDATAVLLDHLPLLVWMKDTQGRFLAVNQAFARASGRSSPSELIGRTDYDFWSAELSNRYREDDKSVMESREPRFVDEPIDLPSGTRYFETFKTAVVNDEGVVVGTVGYARDITERHDSLRKLREHEDALRLFTELASDYVYQIDLAVLPLAPTMVAGSFERITGMTFEEVIARGGWLEVVHPDDRARVEAIGPELQAGTPVSIEYRICRPDGSTRWIRDRVRPVATDGVVTRLVGGVQDVTERRRQEEELRSRNEQLAQAAKLEAVGRLANGVAHDFNNLLTAILGFSQMVAARLPKGQELLDVHEVQAAAERGAALTKQLLAFSRASSDAASTVDVNALLTSLAKMLARLLGSDIAFSLTPEETTATVRIAPTQLEQVIVNLTVNARDAMPAGGTLELSVKTVDLSTEQAASMGVSPGAFVRIRVADTGVGFDESTRARLFEPFFTTKEPGRGTGLGLATSYGIVRQAQGALVPSSPVGGGATFDIYLPSVEGNVVPAVVRSHRPAVNRQGNLLFVDDDQAIREVAGRFLRQLGYNVRTAGHAGEALLYAEGGGVEIDLLVTDLVMPDLDGVELARRLRAKRSSLKVLILSGQFPTAPFRAEAEGGARFLSKPFGLSDLAAAVETALGGAG